MILKNGIMYLASLSVFLNLILISCDTKFTPPPGHQGPAITYYSFGKMVVDGKTFNSEVQILPNGTVKRWSPDDRHYILPSDIEEIVNTDIEVLIIGIGAHGACSVADETIEYLNANSIIVHILNTHKASELYNKSPKDHTGAVFHLDC